MRFAVIYALILAVITTIVCVLKPTMHKRAVIVNHRYKIVSTVEPAAVETKIVTQTPTIQQHEIKTQTVVPPTPVAQTKVTAVQPVSKATTNVQPVKTTTPVKTTVTSKQVQQPQKIQTQKVQPAKVQPAKVQTQKVQTTTASKPTKAEPAKPVKQTPQVLTPQQETILWNTWRSNLQNSIINNVNMPNLPIGTTFKYSFNVDKNGRITNIKCSSPNPKYTPYAIQYIIPVIRSYQGKNILKFPNGSNRESVLFEGNIRVSNTSKYSTASDYNDIETIKH